MSTINLTNYEAFYLDYLEGNLSETDRVAFELFLNEHPEIEMEGELPDFTLTMDEQLSSDFISQLRVFDEHETINTYIIEGFLIASAEGILSNEKQKELQAYLLKNPSHLDTLGVYRKTKLKPDLNISFPNKRGLKKGNDRRLIFGVISAIAAVFVGVILLFSKEEFNKINYSPKLFVKKEVKSDMSINTHEKNNVLPIKHNKEHIIACFFGNPVESQVDTDSLVESQLLPQLAIIVSNNVITTKVDSLVHEKATNEFVAFSEMKSPIDPIFHFAFKKFRDKIDLRYSRATETKQGGFYLKLWNFEVSRKVAPTGDLASK